MSENRKNSSQFKMRPSTTIALSVILSLLCGLGGGWFAVTHLQSESTVVYQTTQSTNTNTAISNSNLSNANSVALAAANASPSVVEIMTEEDSINYGIFGGSYTSQAAGSGVIISNNGYIITNNHVVENANKIQVTTYDGETYDATLVGTDKDSDIGVIKINADNLTSATLADSSKIQVGDTAIVIGNPLGTLGGTVTDGIISAVSREIVLNGTSMDLIQTNAEINSGNSGGGLFDGNGNLIGIVNAKDSGTTSSGATIEGIGFAIPINYAMEIAEDIIENGKVMNRATIGVYLQELPQDTSQFSAGLYITDTAQGSSAEKVGLQAYDRIISVDGEEINSYASLKKFLRDKNVGDVIEMKIERDKKELTFEVELTGSQN